MMTKEKINIILVDDSKVFIEGLKIILSKCLNCFVLDTCNNGNELLESQYLSESDLIILDIEMPVMNGLEAAKRVNIIYPYLPMLALTMHYDKVFLEDIIGAGFKGFIYKPEVSKRLNEVISKILNNEFVFPDNLKIIGKK
ncbi:MAG: response regulator transcription factor [Chloroflexia bacterium]|nr:response regulator transcription factor [Chloroflexia bacterium]